MILFFDLETTGLPTRRQAHYSELSVWPRIVSLSWALFRGSDAKVKHYCTIIRPDGFAIPAEATRIHGITTGRALREGAHLRTTLASLLQDIDLHRPKLIVAHNMDFDRPILLSEFMRLGLGDSLASLPTFCTMAGTTQLCRIPRAGGGYKWPTLDELHRHLFRTGIEGAHDAGSDVLSCARCFFKLQQMGCAEREIKRYVGKHGFGARK